MYAQVPCYFTFYSQWLAVISLCRTVIGCYFVALTMSYSLQWYITHSNTCDDSFQWRRLGCPFSPLERHAGNALDLQVILHFTEKKLFKIASSWQHCLPFKHKHSQLLEWWVAVNLQHLPFSCLFQLLELSELPCNPLYQFCTAYQTCASLGVVQDSKPMPTLTEVWTVWWLLCFLRALDLSLTINDHKQVEWLNLEVIYLFYGCGPTGRGTLPKQFNKGKV